MLLAAIGLGGLGALAAMAMARPARHLDGVIIRLQCYTLLAGWLLYALTRGAVFDRYLLVWAFMLPVIWVRVLPRWLIVLQTFGLALIAWLQIESWLF